MTSEPSTADYIHAYIRESFLTPEDALVIGADDDLLELLDSLQVLRMITDLEARYGIKFQNSEMTPENLGSISKLASFVESKR
jgi:acyl carrier protein